MDWVLHHLQLIVAIGGSIAWWLSQSKVKRTGPAGEPPEKTFGDPDLAERTRRIREDIQRKIDQRSRGYSQPSPTRVESTPSDLPPILRELMGIPPPEPEAPARPAVAEESMVDVLAHQAALAAQLKQAREMKTAARQARTNAGSADQDEATATTANRAELADDLRSPESLRRAFVLREVLGPPVALRD